MTLLGSGKVLQSIATEAIRAVESYQPESVRLYEDRVGLDLLPPLWQLFIRPMRFSWIRGPLLAYRERQVPGVIGNLVCRTRYIDDVLSAALADGVEQVVILGAGFDSRAYRVPGIEETAVFEVDHPDAQKAKMERVNAVFGSVPDHVTFVPIDFNTQSLETELERTAFDPTRETLFIWEGVTQYITEEAVDSTLSTLSAVMDSATLVFTYIEAGIVDGTDRSDAAAAAMAVAEEQASPWITGFDPMAVEEYLDERGFVLEEDADAAVYRARYLDPIDRELPLFDGEHAVVASIRESAGD